MTVYEGPIHVSSPFGWRNHPITGARQHHNGKDMVGRQSKQQRMVAESGTCVLAQYDAARGYNVVIKLDGAKDDVRLRYQHQKALALAVGARVCCGDIVGVEGSSGDSTGSHCHFEVTVNGAVVDPSPWDGLPNLAGVYTGNNSVERSDRMTMLPIFTPLVDSLEVFTRPDVAAVVTAGNGKTRRLPVGDYVVYQRARLAGSPMEGVQVKLEGSAFWVADWAGKARIGEISLSQAETRGLTGARSAGLAAGVEQAKATLAACQSAGKAAEKALKALEG